MFAVVRALGARSRQSAAARHAEHAAHDAHRPGGRMLFDKGKLHRGISAKIPTAFLRCRAPSAPAPARRATARPPTPDPRVTPSSILAASPPDSRRHPAFFKLALPAAQHRRHDPQLSCYFGLQATARLPQRHRLALELIREPPLRPTCHHTPPGPAEPITGVRQIEGRSPSSPFPTPDTRSSVHDHPATAPNSENW